MDLSNLNEDDQTFIEGNFNVYFIYLINIIVYSNMCFTSFLLLTFYSLSIT